MKRSTKIFAAIAATATLALAGAAFSHPGGGPGFGPGMGPGHGMGYGMGYGMGPGGMGPGMMGPGGFDMNAAAAGRLAALKAQLQITPAQEPAWKAYEATVTKPSLAGVLLR